MITYHHHLMECFQKHVITIRRIKLDNQTNFTYRWPKTHSLQNYPQLSFQRHGRYAYGVMNGPRRDFYGSEWTIIWGER